MIDWRDWHDNMGSFDSRCGVSVAIHDLYMWLNAKHIIFSIKQDTVNLCGRVWRSIYKSIWQIRIIGGGFRILCDLK